MPATAPARKNRKPSKRKKLAAVYSDNQVGVFASSKPDAKRLSTVEELHEHLESMGSNRGGIDIRGRVIAQLGIFKDRRGQFDDESLQLVESLGNGVKGGLKSNFRHPSLSNDGLGSYLGRDHDFYLDEASGTPKVRSSHFVLTSTAMKPSPDGGGTPFGEYVAELAITDASAFSSSLQLNYKPATELDGNNEPAKDSDGNLNPKIWRPTRLWAIDVVDTGDAVDDFLGLEGLSDNDSFAREANELINRFFDVDKMTPDALDSRLTAFKEKVIQLHFEDTMSTDDQNESKDLSALLEGQEKTNELLGTMGKGIEALLSREPGEPKPAEGGDGDGKSGELSYDDAQKITSLCKAQGHGDLAPEMLKQVKAGQLSIEGVKDTLLEKNANDRTLDQNSNDDQGGNLGKGGTGEPTADEKLSAEWEAEKEVCENLGMTKEEFVATRKIELGVEPETAPLLKSTKAITAAAGLVLIAGLLAFSAFDFSGVNPMALISALTLVGVAVSSNQISGVDGKVRRVRRKVGPNEHLYDGTFAFLEDGSGDLISYPDGGAYKLGGFLRREVDNSGGKMPFCEVVVEGLVTPVGATHSLVRADIGKTIYASDNHTLTINAGTGGPNGIAGILEDIDDKGRPVIRMG